MDVASTKPSVVTDFKDTIIAYAELVKAFSYILAIVCLYVLLNRLFRHLFSNSQSFSLNLKDIIQLSVGPSKKIVTASEENENKLSKPDNNDIPSDYFYIVHTSFLRPEKQAEFKRNSNVDADHYDIRVIVNSYYQGAIERVNYVKYFLHEAYPKPIQYSNSRENKFLLKELANGEYVLTAEVYLYDLPRPLVLQRYITLIVDGPRIENYITP